MPPARKRTRRSSPAPDELAEADEVAFGKPLRELPEDPAELDKAIASCRVMVRPILHGISRLATTLDTEPLDKDELDSGIIAFSALMYQYGAMLDARVLITLWLVGITLPRVIERLQKDRDKEKQKKLAAAAPPAPPAAVAA